MLPSRSRLFFHSITSSVLPFLHGLTCSHVHLYRILFRQDIRIRIRIRMRMLWDILTEWWMIASKMFHPSKPCKDLRIQIADLKSAGSVNIRHEIGKSGNRRFWFYVDAADPGSIGHEICGSWIYRNCADPGSEKIALKEETLSPHAALCI